VGVGVNWICVLVEISPLFPVLSFANIACDVIDCLWCSEILGLVGRDVFGRV